MGDREASRVVSLIPHGLDGLSPQNAPSLCDSFFNSFGTALMLSFDSAGEAWFYVAPTDETGLVRMAGYVIGWIDAWETRSGGA